LRMTLLGYSRTIWAALASSMYAYCTRGRRPSTSAPPELGKPQITPDFDLKRRAVKLEKNCKIKYRGRVNPWNERSA